MVFSWTTRRQSVCRRFLCSSFYTPLFPSFPLPLPHCIHSFIAILAVAPSNGLEIVFFFGSSSSYLTAKVLAPCRPFVHSLSLRLSFSLTGLAPTCRYPGVSLSTSKTMGGAYTDRSFGCERTYFI